MSDNSNIKARPGGGEKRAATMAVSGSGTAHDPAASAAEVFITDIQKSEIDMF